ncbi:MAG TPA: protein kinase, partial [Longimicrobiales bacterium]
MTSCSSCGYHVSPEDAFCANCGTKVQTVDRTVLASRRIQLARSAEHRDKCESCNAPFQTGDVFCVSCGARRPDTGERDAVRSRGGDRIRERLEAATSGEFEILIELGRGGMGAVYLAREQALHRYVAIKVLAPYLLAEESMLERFRNEARIVAALRHPAIVNIHAVRHAEDLHFFVMDYIEGASLNSVIRAHGPLPVSIVEAVLYDVGSALSYAHRQGTGVIHRDIKPGNIMLDAEGAAVVMDFGISKAVNATSGLTMTGAIIGTPEYMSPEQCRGDSLTTASDQYALGLVAYAMLSGAPPFSGQHYAVLLAQTSEEPAPIGGIRPDCPHDLAESIHRMMRKTPSERWPDIRDGLKAFGGRHPEHDDPVRGEIAILVREADDAVILAVPVAKVTVGRPPEEILPGDKFVLQAVPVDGLGRAIQGRELVWSTTDPGVVEITPEGAMKALREGTARVVARCEGHEVDVEIAVIRPAVARVQVTSPPDDIRPGDRFRLEATPVDKRGAPLDGRTVAWYSSAPEVAVVEAEGEVRAVAEGSARLVAAVDGIESAVELGVLPERVARLGLSSPPERIVPGDRFVLRATAQGASGVILTDPTVTWSSTDARVASVSPRGEVVAKRVGSASVVARVEQRSAPVEASVDISVRSTVVTLRTLAEPGALATVAEAVARTSEPPAGPHP